MAIGAVGGNKRRHERYDVHLPARAVAGDREHKAVVRDISESGARIETGLGGVPIPDLDNNAFVALHMEGHEHLEGRVVRNFSDGYALEFEISEREQERMRDELAKFRKIAGGGSD